MSTLFAGAMKARRCMVIDKFLPCAEVDLFRQVLFKCTDHLRDTDLLLPPLLVPCLTSCAYLTLSRLGTPAFGRIRWTHAFENTIGYDILGNPIKKKSDRFENDY